MTTARKRQLFIPIILCSALSLPIIADDGREPRSGKNATTSPADARAAPIEYELGSFAAGDRLIQTGLQLDCESATRVDDEGLVDLGQIGITRRSSGLCAIGQVDRAMDYEAACYRVWLDKLIAARSQLLADNPKSRPKRIDSIDRAIRDAAMFLMIRGEAPGPLPFEFAEEDFPPAPTVNLADVLRANNTTPKQFRSPTTDDDSRDE
ncbi:MAG: hypothetical protein H6818_21795 [Phycisphaerales bacterium]|nr:hypothetical protein [Phycisphaerales bacterium]MCB9862425.1 hypothetical protein [Phycisphaerales bacterium]